MFSLKTWTYIVVVLLALVPWSLILSMQGGFDFKPTYIIMALLGVAIALYSLKLFMIYRGQVGKTYFFIIILLAIMLTISGSIHILDYLQH
ncbi:putative membrane protein [Bacillus phage SP-15]|uniref:Putative membrane protein n=1 Tax=Bacillus phage SP-15 TaxID=1792032 RepID=A0A127AVV7_9CAUD|nr:hypothetical protein SP15_007A [Bacillus phage SP-15]AMM44806.1 putative membrane protein [Bacillus phage SP-15]